ncbi:hypothetical protein [Kitasatospora sp. NPDC093679]|uniref:hypothetical protein n=1 Tax=Kitasatospora sp. NPDC093679 TaxID=3154983 RepID=UPI003447D15D
MDEEQARARHLIAACYAGRKAAAEDGDRREMAALLREQELCQHRDRLQAGAVPRIRLWAMDCALTALEKARTGERTPRAIADHHLLSRWLEHTHGPHGARLGLDRADGQ